MTNEVQTKRNKKAFTLVELIIVITILAILATIAYISFQWYSKNARDGNRLATTKNIDTWLQVYKVKTGNFPMPEDYIELLSSWTVIGYQWYFWNDAVNAISMNTLPIDPLDNARFTYTVNKAKALYQGVMYLESSENISFLPTTYAESINYTSRFIKTFWNQLWILLSNSWANINKPLQELKSSSFTGIDIQSPTQINAIWEIKVIFNNNRDDDIFSNLSSLWKVTNNYQWMVEYIMAWNCASWWNDVGLISGTTGGDPIQLSPLRICQNKTENITIWAKLIMPTCPSWWANNAWVEAYYWSDNIDINPTLRICENNWGAINIWSKVVMPACPNWWIDAGWVNISYQSEDITMNTALRVCEKI